MRSTNPFAIMSRSFLAFLLILIFIAPFQKAFSKGKKTKYQIKKTPITTQEQFFKSGDKHNRPPSHPLEKGYLRADFDKLGKFELKLKAVPPVIKEIPIDKQIPKDILKLHGKKVQIEGYLFPLELDGTKVKTGVLLKHPFGCKFGRTPKANEMIVIQIVGIPQEISSVRTTVAWGELQIGEAVLKKNKGATIYLLKASKLKNLKF